jgi:hypothetical protein
MPDYEHVNGAEYRRRGCRPSCAVVPQCVRAAIFHVLGGMSESINDREAKAEILTATQIGITIRARVEPIAAAKLAETIATDVKT